MTYRNPIFEERWQEIATKEKGEEPMMDQAISTYLDIKVVQDKHPELNEKVANLEEAIIRYTMRLNDLAIARLEANQDIIQNMDQSRRLAHNRLIDELNILSREFAKLGLNNRWREKIGLSREQVEDWANAVYPIVCKEELKDEN
jgi:hypothetical protein